jgi:hypothetical protein
MYVVIVRFDGTQARATLLYAVAIFVVTNGRVIWDWLFRLRYGS